MWLSVVPHPAVSLYVKLLLAVGVFTRLPLVFLFAVASLQAEPSALRLLVIAPDTDHIAWASAKQFTGKAGQQVSIDAVLASTPDSPQANLEPDLLLMPLRSLATQVPALEVLELPFFYPDISAVQHAQDGELGRVLKQKARQSGWEILAFLDEGMHVMSGNRRYDRRINLTGMRFVELRPDPMAKKQFLAFDAWTETASPQSQQQLLQQCRVGSRTTSLQKLWSERLDRVHLSLSLSRHRYEGWVLIVPEARWQSLPVTLRSQLELLANDLTLWQRQEALRREAQALENLKQSGMTVHTLSDAQRQDFRDRLPLWRDLLSDQLPLDERKALVAAATAGPGLAPEQGLQSLSQSDNSQ